MKNLILTVLVLLSLSFAVSAKNSRDSLYHVRSYIVNELLNVGFNVDEYKKGGKIVTFTHQKGPGDFIYQAVITVRKNKIVFDGYITSPEGVNPAYIKKPWSGLEHLEDVWEVAMDKYEKKIRTNHIHQLKLHSWYTKIER